MPFTTAIVAAVLVYIWFIEGRAARELVYIPGTLVVALAVWHNTKAGEWGFSRKGVWRAVRAVLVVTLPAALLFLAVGAAIGTLHDRRDFLGSFAALYAWGSAQQWVLQTVVLREAQRATSQNAGVLIAALLFGAVHLPNPFLAPVTGAAALVWCRIYDRYPNVLPLALSHALGTLAILYAFDETITGRLRIGMSYLRLVGP
ncbi:MAG TPA: CPBP family intramembrane glutamic endopeptidase [Vicinamibacterales bacterium]|nr:CPBP family intramembrane glutamic endopeptidase [Vicinamibacterales bacterium]